MFYKINGSAGYGKTHALLEQIKTLYVASENEQDFILITPTNKAAMVLNNRLDAIGYPPLAKTLHSTLYMWQQTDRIKSVKKIRDIDSETLKFKVDISGNPIYSTETQYEYIKTIKDSIRGKTVLVDESSMVNSEVWYDLITSGITGPIYAYGDEKQLPPIEEYANLAPEIKPYFQFWHSFDEAKSITTLKVNYRQQGNLKTFVEAIENTLFNYGANNDIPTPLMIGDNFSIHASHIAEADLQKELMDNDIIITPYNKVRQLCNAICRQIIAQNNGKKFQKLPIVGDKIIFVDPIREKVKVGPNTYQRIYLAKNVCAVITNVVDYSLKDNLMVIDFVDEMGVTHTGKIVSLNTINGLTAAEPGIARIDFAYAVTVHSSQGGQWDKVLFLNGHWPGNDAKKLRYVGITRAKTRLSIINGIMNTTESKDASKSVLVRLGQQVQNKGK